MKVLITGLFTQAGLFAVRRFGQLGYEVTAADNHKLAFGLYSKYVSKRVILPSLRKKPLLYAKAVINLLKNEKYDYYFPAFEEMYLLSHYRNEILSLTKTIIPTHKDLMSLHDKASLKKIVMDSGEYYPQTYVPKSYNDFLNNRDNYKYPLYIKIRKSRNSTGLRYVESKQVVKQLFDDVMYRNNLDEDQLPILQQKVKGQEITYSALAQNGEVIGESQYVGIRYIPRKGGTTVCRETVFNKVCSEAGKQFIKSINWTGLIGIDYIIDDKDGKPYIIDVNPRASVCLNVAFFGGIDLIPQWIKISNGEKANVLPKIKTDIKTSTHFADVMWLVYTYYKGPESWKERKALREKWWTNRNNIAYDIICKDDWKPRIALNVFLFKQVFKLLFSKLEASNLFLYYNSYCDTFLKEDLKIKSEKEYSTQKEKFAL